jgi:hypothetical protein
MQRAWQSVSDRAQTLFQYWRVLLALRSCRMCHWWKGHRPATTCRRVLDQGQSIANHHSFWNGRCGVLLRVSICLRTLIPVSLAKPKCINGRALIPETAVVPPLPSIRRAISLPILMTWKWYFRRVQLRLR